MCDNIEINKELFDVIMRLKRQSHGNIKLKDLYAGEFMALRIIYKLKMDEDKDSLGVKTSDISNCMFMKKPTTSKMLNNLEDKGYIIRLSDKKDRRITYIDLTQKGIDLLEKHHKEMVDYTNLVISKLGKEDTETLVDLLNKLSDIMEDLNKN